MIEADHDSRGAWPQLTIEKHAVSALTISVVTRLPSRRIVSGWWWVSSVLSAATSTPVLTSSTQSRPRPPPTARRPRHYDGSGRPRRWPRKPDAVRDARPARSSTLILHRTVSTARRSGSSSGRCSVDMIIQAEEAASIRQPTSALSRPRPRPGDTRCQMQGTTHAKSTGALAAPGCPGAPRRRSSGCRGGEVGSGGGCEEDAGAAATSPVDAVEPRRWEGSATIPTISTSALLIPPSLPFLTHHPPRHHHRCPHPFPPYHPHRLATPNPSPHTPGIRGAKQAGESALSRSQQRGWGTTCSTSGSIGRRCRRPHQ